jgi:hypothetical protein
MRKERGIRMEDDDWKSAMDRLYAELPAGGLNFYVIRTNPYRPWTETDSEALMTSVGVVADAVIGLLDGKEPPSDMREKLAVCLYTIQKVLDHLGKLVDLHRPELAEMVNPKSDATFYAAHNDGASSGPIEEEGSTSEK